MKNKKGADTSMIIIMLVIAIIILLAVGWWFTTRFLKSTETIEKYDKSTVEAMIQACNLAVTPYGFCEDWKEVSGTTGKKTYVNCQWSQVKSSITNPIACAQNEDYYAKAKCSTLTGVDYTKVFVNDKSCSQWGVTAPAK
ncbi:MAG: hypothetical protein MUF61_00395 [archaeon]|jgi:hypothetical protein|nr:hypothetical protein [archaeon]